MDILINGIDYTTGKPLVASRDAQSFADTLTTTLESRVAELQAAASRSSRGTTFRAEVELGPSTNLDDPRSAGWTFLVAAGDPNKDAIIQALRPLAEFRGMEDPTDPLLYDAESPDDWFDWLTDNYSSLVKESLPHYVLIVGGPKQVPFWFQSLLDSLASAGRVDFDSLDDLRAYAEKVCRLEDPAADPVVSRDCLIFAPDGGPNDATHFSNLYMAQPLSQLISQKLGFPTTAILGEEATKAAFVAALADRSPALVYTASHGLGAPRAGLDVQKQVNGALCCQHGPDASPAEWLFRGLDVPTTPFVEGGVFFQFACYGYGTPATSDFMHWMGEDSLNSEEDFVAALPKRLLAHPRGPIAYVGHVDVAWLHGFADPESPYILDTWQPRMAPFASAVRRLLETRPVGRAMWEMNQRYDITNAIIANTIDRWQRGKLELTGERKERFVSTFITRSDAQNYMVFGDPAARVRIPA